MNLKNTSFLIIISFFPVFTLRSNLDLIEVIFSISIFVLPILILNFFILSKNFLNKKIFNVYLASIIVFGIDNNLGLWNGFIEPSRQILLKNFDVIYYPGFFLLIILISLISILLSFTDKKFLNVIIVFLTTIFLFNIFDQTKSFKKIKDYENVDNLKYKMTDVVIVFDEMSGLNSFSSKTKNGKEFDLFAKKLFKKYDFELYSNIYSITNNSISSLSSLLNFSNSEKLRLNVTKKSKNYFYEYELEKSLFFEKFNSINIYQNIHIDYCLFDNIKKCKTYNPFDQKVFLIGFKNSFLTKIISLWKLNGSIFSTLNWRFLREIRLIDSNLEPEGHKISFNDFFNNLEKDIYSNNYDLIFAHTLVPHRPYGFKEDCTYDGSLSIRNSSYSTDKSVNQHNIERMCVLKFIEKFLKNLEKKQYIDKINLTILSDHGSRIMSNKDSSLSVIYAYRNKNTKYKEIKREVLSQNIFSKTYN